jgi:cell division protein FtsL
MPRIDEKKKNAKELASQIEEADSSLSNLPAASKKQQEQAAKSDEKDSLKWGKIPYSVLYFIIAVIVFILGIVLICAINYWTEGHFSL